jgi:hypothetical protein
MKEGKFRKFTEEKWGKMLSFLLYYFILLSNLNPKDGSLLSLIIRRGHTNHKVGVISILKNSGFLHNEIWSVDL